MFTEIFNAPRAYAWGSTHLIAEMQGRAPSGQPEAEVWFGDHPASPAVTEGGRLLTTLGGEPLPFLVKLLAAASPLSIQVHPSQDQAVQGFAREEARGLALDAADRNYRDSNHKPEILVALSDEFTALAGLRDLKASRRLVDQLGGDAEPLAARLARGSDAEALRTTLRWLLAENAPVRQLIQAILDCRSNEFAGELSAVGALAAEYPDDPGVIVALLMNFVTLTKGEALYAPAGMLHAYLRGLGVEVMATSDNVLRGGLTPKHIDVEELLLILDATPGPAPVLTPLTVAEGAELYSPGLPDFELLRVSSLGDPVRLASRGPMIAVVIDSYAVLKRGREELTLNPGRAAYISASAEPTLINGGGTVLVARQP